MLEKLIKDFCCNFVKLLNSFMELEKSTFGFLFFAV